ncbi:MAG: hypothetical protein EOP04_06235 [Proteobacteria bacterium]|nr:MAG: hypothetical protein EOP04_06235 [Pseudomonadota bacterium]
MSYEPDYPDRDPDIRSTPLYAVLCCGLVIIVVGICLALNGETSTGYLPGGRTGSGSKTGVINGPIAIVLGILFAAWPLYYLIKKRHGRSGRK